MATPFDATPKWFNADFYLDAKLANLIVEDPKGNWTRASLLEAFKLAEFTNPYDHYLAYGDMEGLSPNPLFSNTEYLAAKTAQMGSTWTPEMVAKAIADAGLTLMQHYEQFGSAEGLSPSSAFNQDKYYDAKLDLLQTTEPDKAWTLETLKAAFADANLSPLDHYLTYGTVEGLDKYDYSVNGKPIPHPGNTKIVLTTGADVVSKDAESETLRSSDRDDVISALVSGSKSTLNAGDVIDGGAGVDTLEVDMKGGNFAFGSKGGSVKNVEYVELANADGRTFDAKGVENVTAYTVDSAKGTVKITNVDSANTDYVLTKEAGSLDVTIADAALAGKTDNVSVTLNGVGVDKDAPVAIGVKGATSGKLETLTLVAEGANSYVSVANNQDTLAVEGAGNMTITSVGAGLKTFDASDATGKVNATLTGTTGLKSITGGSANDTITVGVPATGATFAGGDGDDKLVFASLGNVTVKAAISEFETLQFKDADSSSGATITFNATGVTDVETIQYAGASGNDTLTVTGASAWNDLTFAIDNKVGTSAGTFTYDGTGVLNISAYGETAGALKFASVTATAVDTVNISNASAGKFELTKLDANKATTLNVNTGDFEFKYADASGDAHAALQYVNLSGNGDAVITFGTNTKALEEINASDLKGTLRLAFSPASNNATGVTVNMGDYGAILFGANKADTFNLGAGTEAVGLATNPTADLADTINNFRSNDLLWGVVSASNVVFTNVARGNGKLMMFTKDGLDLADTDSTKTVDVAMTGFLTGVAGAAALSANSAIYFAIDNGDDIGIYKVTMATNVAASSAATAGSITTGIQLMGIVSDTDLSALSATNFVM